MSRIDASVASQVADVARPIQVDRDRVLQTQAAQVDELHADPGGEPVRADDVRAAAAHLKQVVETTSNRHLAFEVDDDSGELVVTIRDSEGGQVIKQIPSKELLELHERLNQLVGVLFDQDA